VVRPTRRVRAAIKYHMLVHGLKLTGRCAQAVLVVGTCLAPLDSTVDKQHLGHVSTWRTGRGWRPRYGSQTWAPSVWLSGAALRCGSTQWVRMAAVPCPSSLEAGAVYTPFVRSLVGMQDSSNPRKAVLNLNFVLHFRNPRLHYACVYGRLPA
jgi:hypothetical protein